MRIDRLDHLVLTVADPMATTDFYIRVLGMEPVAFGDGRQALAFGPHKINLHVAGREFAPHADRPAPGAADLCFVVADPLMDVVEHLENEEVPIELGPVSRTGALGPIVSVYIRDPDRNLIELCNYVE